MDRINRRPFIDKRNSAVPSLPGTRRFSRQDEFTFAMSKKDQSINFSRLNMSKATVNEMEEKDLVWVACILGMFSCGSLYLAMESFFPVYVDETFNRDVESISVIEIAMCMTFFQVACMLFAPVHAKTISWIGRKRAIIIGFTVQLISNILLGLLSHIPADQPKLFKGLTIATRFL